MEASAPPSVVTNEETEAAHHVHPDEVMEGHSCGEPATPNAPQSRYPMLTVGEASKIVNEVVQPLPPVAVPLHQAVGKVLAKDVVAAHPLPPFRASIKDGYAVRAADGPGDYTVIGEIRAGNDGAHLAVGKGTVAYITTGGPVPAGADAVVQVENTLQMPPGPDGRPMVRIVKGASKAGEDIRPLGSDIPKGALVLEAGERISAAEIGILATVGQWEVEVYPQPLVAVLSTGDELVEPSKGNSLGTGQIFDSNRAMLIAAAKEAGCEVLDLGIALDKEGDHEAKMKEALEAGADVLLSSGGVSMGDKDLIKPLLEKIGKVHFGRVLMKPGKPLTVATVPRAAEPEAATPPREMLVFALPGNPVSSIVTFELMALPALRQLAGWRDPGLPRIEATLAQPLRLDPERPEYHRASLHWKAGKGFIAESTGRQISSRLLSMRSAMALLELPQGEGTLAQGSSVPALLISDLNTMRPSDVPRMPLEGNNHRRRAPHAHRHRSHGHGHALSEGQQSLSSDSSKAKEPASTTNHVAKEKEAGLFGGGVRVGVLTISDTVSKGQGIDTGGPAAIRALAEALPGAKVVATAVVADEPKAISSAIKRWCDEEKLHLVLTTGGTGLSPRDYTPEATRNILDKEAPGLVHAMMAHSLSITPSAMLSRMAAGVRGSTLVINTPGNPNAIGECLDSLKPALRHALRQVSGDKREKHPRHQPHKPVTANATGVAKPGAVDQGPVGHEHKEKAAHHRRHHNHGHHHQRPKPEATAVPEAPEVVPPIATEATMRARDAKPIPHEDWIPKADPVSDPAASTPTVQATGPDVTEDTKPTDTGSKD